MTFVEPQYAWALFVLPVIALLKIFADGRAQRAMEAFASSERLRKSLLGGASVVWSGLHFGLQLLGLAFLIIAMTRPQLGIIEKEVTESGRNIFIAIDTSKSMLAQDVKPNRLTRAKLAAMDLLEMLPGDRVGLIAFAGRSFLQAPLTTDHEAVRESIQSLDHTTIPRGGSSVAAAIQLALDTVEKAGKGTSGMILFTDGQETDDATIEAANLAAESKLMILPVGVGTVDGDLIPDPEPYTGNLSGYVTDRQGNVVHSRLESGMLREVAKMTNGEYIALSSQALTHDLIQRMTANLQRHEAGSRQENRQAERYQWPLGAGIFCMFLSLFMRPSSRKRILASAVLPTDPQASVHMPLQTAKGMKAMSSILMVWLTFSGLVMALLTPAHAAVDERVKEARQAYADGEYEKARNGFSKLLNDEESRVPRDELSYSLGAVELKLGDESKAVKAFSQSLQSPNPQLQLGSLRALGNVLYEKGKKEREVATKALKERKQKSADEAINRTLKDWEDALAHLGTALQLEPGHEETHQNYDFVKKQLEDLKKEAEQRKQQQQQQQQQQGQKGQEGEQQGDPSEENQGEEGSQPQGENAENQDRDPKQQDAMQEGEQEVPEGQVSAGDGEQGEEKEQEGQNGHQPQGQQQQQQANGKPQDGEQDAKRNEETGFTPMEARSQLRNYADDENSVQYLMRREQPLGGKDY